MLGRLNMFVESGRVICRGRRSWSNVCSGPLFGAATVSFFRVSATTIQRDCPSVSASVPQLSDIVLKHSILLLTSLKDVNMAELSVSMSLYSFLDRSMFEPSHAVCSTKRRLP